MMVGAFIGGILVGVIIGLLLSVCLFEHHKAVQAILKFIDKKLLEGSGE